MGLFETGKIYIFSQPVSWRYGIKGLSIYAATRLNFDIKDGENWFIFISKNRHAIRALHFKQDRAVLYEERLYSGSFPEVTCAQSMAKITREQLQLLFSGNCDGRKVKQLVLSSE